MRSEGKSTKRTKEKEATPQSCSLSLLNTCRWRICFISMTGSVCLLAMRVNLGFAIVCMVIPENSTDFSLDMNFTERSPVLGNTSGDLLTNLTAVWSNRKCGLAETSDTSLIGQGGEFRWDRSLQSKLLASFYYGYIVTQIPGGWLARRYGSRVVIGYSFLLLVLSTMLFPVGARLHVALPFVLRVVAGLASGAVFPAMSCLWGRWAPPLERSKLYAVQQTGLPLGTVLALFTSGFLCENGFDNGWGSIFYVTGLSGLLWVILWFLTVYDTPAEHPRIPEEEKQFIETSIGDQSSKLSKEMKTPWGKIVTSSAVWAGIVAHVGTNWTAITLLVGLPTYMKEVLAFDIKQNGVLSAVPFICSSVTSPLVGYLADALQERRLLSTQNTRRLFESICGLGTAAFMLLVGFVTCENRLLSVVYLSLAAACLDVSKAGQGPNSLDIAPRFAGEIWGLSNTVATLPGMIAPLVNGMLTPHGTQEEWKIVFYLCAGFSVAKTIFFFIFVKGHVLPWASGNVSIETGHAPPEIIKTPSQAYINKKPEINENNQEGFHLNNGL